MMLSYHEYLSAFIHYYPENYADLVPHGFKISPNVTYRSANGRLISSVDGLRYMFTNIAYIGHRSYRSVVEEWHNFEANDRDLDREATPNADLLLLDAATMNTDRQFDGIYSNKVLYHLERDTLMESFQRQATVLKPGGIALHSFWYGDSAESMHGLIFTYYNEETLRDTVGDALTVLAIERYTEMEEDDSLYIVLQGK